VKALHSLFKTDNNVGPLIARVMLGAVMFPHGAQKALGWFGGYGLSGTMNYFTGTMHIPALLAFLAIAAEFAGALALIAGVTSRVAAFGIASVMAVAILTSHAANGFFMNWFGNQKGEGFEYHLLAIGLALIVILQGGGKASVDALIARRLSGSRAASGTP
jgi:putative oxidoreductase